MKNRKLVNTVSAAALLALLLSPPAVAKPKKTEKAAKPSKADAALVEAAKKTGLSSEEAEADVKLFTRILVKVKDGCAYLWPYSQKLQEKCVKSEMDNVNEMIRNREFE